MDLPPPVPPPIPAARPPVKAWQWWTHLLVIGSYPLLIGVLGHFQKKSFGDQAGPALGSGSGELLLMSLFTMGTFAVIFGLGWAATRATADDLRLRWSAGWWAWPLGLGYSVALRLGLGAAVVVVAGVATLLGGVSSEEVRDFFMENQPDVGTLVAVDALETDFAYLFLSVTLVSFVVAGLREELWRSATLVALERLFPRVFGGRMGQCVAVVLIAVVFGLGRGGAKDPGRGAGEVFRSPRAVKRPALQRICSSQRIA